MQDITLENLRPHLLYRFKSEHELEKSIEKVGAIFNHMRSHLDEYANDEKMISAYVAYYLATNFPKLESVLNMVGIDLSDYKSLIDIGTGPGTFLLAAHALNPHLELVGIDQSDLMLNQAMKLTKGLGVNCPISFGKKLLKENNDKNLFLFSHSINEMLDAQIDSYLDTIDNQDILIIEPGTKEVYQKLMLVRQKMIEKNYNIHFPCSSNESCLMNQEHDWCHQYIMVKHSEDIERMTQKLQRNRRLLPLVVQFYSKKEKSKSVHARLVRVFKPTKYSFEWEVCMPDHSLVRLEIPSKIYSKSEQKRVVNVTAGSKVEFTLIKELKDRLRVEVTNMQDLIQTD